MAHGVFIIIHFNSHCWKQTDDDDDDDYTQ